MRLYRFVTTLALAAVLLPVALYVADASGLGVGFQVLIALLIIVPPMAFRRVGASLGVLAFAVLVLLLIQGWAGIFLGAFSALGAVALAAWPAIGALLKRVGWTNSTSIPSGPETRMRRHA